MAFEFSLKFGSKEKQANKAVKLPTLNSASNILPKDFIPLTQLQNLKNQKDLLLFLFKSVAEINAIVTYIAQIAANVKYEHVLIQANGKEKEVKNSQYINLLKNPNQLDTGYNLLINLYSEFFITGDIFINKLIPTGFDYPTKLYRLPSNRVYPIVRGAIDQYGEIPSGFDIRSSELVKYNQEIDTRFISHLPESIIHIKDSSLEWSGKEQLYGQSRVASAVQNIESLNYMTETINNILSRAGALGFVKKNIKAGEYSNLSDPIVKKQIEDAFYSYGVRRGQSPIMFTDMDLSYQKIFSPLNEFIPIELKTYEFDTLCKVIGGFPKVLLESSDSTFANLKEAQKLLYINIIIPLVNSFADAFTKGFKLPENEKIVADWDDIEALQTNKKDEAGTMKAFDEAWYARYENNLITENELLIALELKTKPDGNRYKREVESESDSQTETGENGENEQQTNSI